MKRKQRLYVSMNQRFLKQKKSTGKIRTIKAFYNFISFDYLRNAIFSSLSVFNRALKIEDDKVKSRVKRIPTFIRDYVSP